MNLKSWFKGLRGRLLAVALLPIVGFALSSYIAFDGVTRVTGYLSSAHNEIIPGSKYLSRLIVARNKYGYNIFVAMAVNDNTQLKKDRLALAREAVEEWRQNFTLYDKLPHYQEEMENIKFIANNKDRYLGMLEDVIKFVDEGSEESLKKAQDLLLGEIWSLGTEIGKNNGAIAQIYEKRAEDEGKKSDEVHASVKLWMAVVNVTASVLILAIIIMISSRIANHISSIAKQLSGASQNVSNSVHQLNEAGSSLSQSSTEAAASLEETVASLEELTSMVQVNADNARQAAALSSSSKDSAENGEREMRKLIQSMDEISKSSKKIEEIISVIDDIAFQTNLLALNASVEAARAGEQGKGFAVVAEAVRALAQRSAVAAKDISTLIKLSVEQVEAGSKVADQSGEALGSILESVKKVADLNNEIAAASSEQSSGIQQINKAMNQLDQASQSNAASAEEIAATSGEINNLARSTQSLTVDLNILIWGSGGDENSEAA